MKRPIVLVAALVGLWACSDAVGELMQDAGTMLSDGAVPDAGASPSTVVELNCPSEGGFILTDVDQRPLGQIVIRQTFPDPWGVTDPPQNVEGQFLAWWSIEGKVLVQCNGDTSASTIEIL